MLTLKITSCVLLIVCAVCLLVAYERYQAHVDAVQFAEPMNGGMVSTRVGEDPRTGLPAASKYALFGAMACGAVGVFCLVSACGAGRR